MNRRGFTIVELLIVIVVIGILAAITIVAYTGITQNANKAALTADIKQLQTKAAVYRAQNGIDDCPAGYSFVYGNSTLGTSPFCVMKYEAKNVSGVATSQASGAPWVSITQTDAITQSTNAGGHLLTEAEWMTIAADVLSMKQNWSGGSVNSGIIYQGHVNNNPGSALAASDDDTDNLNGMTGGIGTNSGNNSSRVLYLSSGDAIWDFSGNVWEWTQQAIGTPTLTMSNVGVSGDSAFNWRDYTLGSLSLGNLANVSKPATLNGWTNPVNNVSLSGITWGAGKGVGQIYANYADSASRAFRRGGYWSNGSAAGVLTLYLNGSASNSHAGIGFRVAR
ncbi:type II secretion system protein [Candidatus Saccharibacteria bacterium]|nr:type II secretion system protein [Candidatus Saccharibacteria bacterium]